MNEAEVQKITISEYRVAWPQQFLLVSEELKAIGTLRGAVIEHIGSTSVPGLCAKPVLDIALGVRDMAQAEYAIYALADADFVYRREYERVLPERRYFVRPECKVPRVHLHAVLLGGDLWQRHLYFRDRLRGDSLLREEYARLKRDLSRLHEENKCSYTEAKAPFIQRVLASRER